jgi:hypothetical protein
MRKGLFLGTEFLAFCRELPAPVYDTAFTVGST